MRGLLTLSLNTQSCDGSWDHVNRFVFVHALRREGRAMAHASDGGDAIDYLLYRPCRAPGAMTHEPGWSSRAPRWLWHVWTVETEVARCVHRPSCAQNRQSEQGRLVRRRPRTPSHNARAAAERAVHSTVASLPPVSRSGGTDRTSRRRANPTPKTPHSPLPTGPGVVSTRPASLCSRGLTGGLAAKSPHHSPEGLATSPRIAPYCPVEGVRSRPAAIL